MQVHLFGVGEYTSALVWSLKNMQVHLFGVWRLCKCTCLEFGEYTSAPVWSLENMQVHLFGEYAHAFVWRICKCICVKNVPVQTGVDLPCPFGNHA